MQINNTTEPDEVGPTDKKEPSTPNSDQAPLSAPSTSTALDPTNVKEPSSLEHDIQTPKQHFLELGQKVIPPDI